MNDTERLDAFMLTQPEGYWELDGDYWKSYHTDTSEEVECYSYIYRRIGGDGKVMAGYTMLEGGYDEGDCMNTTYDSLDDMIEAEFDS